ncbi:MAG: hypothetical protein DWG76_04115 [Chloroflexi bacterium]|nr:hypothetical protein [Chloroflexota bacterium]
MSGRRPVWLFLALMLAACSPAAASPTVEPTSTASPSAPTDSPVSAPEISNLALRAPVSASAALPDFPAEQAVDGISTITAENWWSAGDSPTQWIEIDLGAAAAISEIRLLPSQSPAGSTVHRILGCKSAGGREELHVFRGNTEDGQWLEFSPAQPLQGYTCLRIETIESPSWVAWREIEILGFPLAPQPVAAADEATLIFHNGEVLSMQLGFPTYAAIAIHDDLILKLGSDEDILALAGPATRVIDLQGLTLMPGFVDPHTHYLKDSGLGIEAAQQVLFENGFTSTTEMSATPDFMEQIIPLAENGVLRIRTSIYMQYTDPCGEPLGDWYQAFPRGQEFGERLRIAGVKLFADGGVCGLPAVSFDYPQVGGKGDLWFSQEALTAAVADIDALGYQVAIHAQGDRAIEQVQIAYAVVFADQPTASRPRIEHNAFHRPDLLPRYAEVGAVATIFGAYETCKENERAAYSNFFGFENLSWLENWRDFLDGTSGVIVAWHGDDPYVVPLSPLLELFGMVTRAQVAEDGSVCEPPDWLAAHAITAEEALPLMTINAAYALFSEDQVGSLAPGKFADLILLSANPLSIDPSAIKDIEVWLTMVGGSTEFCAAGHSELCP